MFYFSAGERLQVKNLFHESALSEHPIVSLFCIIIIRLICIYSITYSCILNFENFKK